MNLTLANKNPFSTFDFLGYFFPGALFIGLIYLVSDGLKIDSDLMPQSIARFIILSQTHQAIALFFTVIIAYVLGHLISYISSISVELFYTWSYGYPTSYLLSDKKGRGLLKSANGRKGKFGHLITCLVLFPITICHFIFERMFGLERFISRKLDSATISIINIEIARIASHYNISKEKQEDWDKHRLIMHYVYEHCNLHQNKFDNYVALYGFLRSITLILNLILWYLIYRYIRYNSFSLNLGVLENYKCCVISILLLLLFVCIGYLLYRCLRSVTSGVPFLFSITISVLTIATYFVSCFLLENKTWFNGETLQIVVVFVTTYISYLGFAKFYRRFTLENFMALITYDTIRNEKQDEESEYPYDKYNPMHIVIDDKCSWFRKILKVLNE